MYKQLEDKEIVWSGSTRKFTSPNKICIELDVADEIPPFLYSLTPALKNFKGLLMRLGAKEKPFAMMYGDILRKMAKVCGDDYLNSNELCKALKAMECFFKACSSFYFCKILLSIRLGVMLCYFETISRLFLKFICNEY